MVIIKCLNLRFFTLILETQRPESPNFAFIYDWFGESVSLIFHVSSNIISLISSRGEASLLIGMSIKSEDHFFECACATPKSGS